MNVTIETMSFEQQTRWYILALPRSPEPRRLYPLVIVFHGEGQSADEIAADAPFEVISGQDAVVVYPNAAAGQWDLRGAFNDNLDMQFVQALRDEIALKIAVDRRRMYGVGFGSGGAFLSQTSCAAARLFRAFAANAGAAPSAFDAAVAMAPSASGCTSGPTAALFVHGSDDPDVDLAGTEAVAASWAATNACAASGVEAWTPTSRAECRAASSCSSGKPVQLCVVPGLAHSVWTKGWTVAWEFFGASP